MNEVKRIEIDHKGLPFSDGNGVFVFYNDYASLEAKCAALAVEAAYLRDEIKQHSLSTHFCGNCGEADPCITDDVCWSLKHPIPATDAILAEIERKAIRKFINSIEHILRDKLSPYDTEEMLEDMRIFLEEQGAKQ